MEPVTLINAFEISPGSESSFLERWERIMAFLRQQRGFVSVALRQNPDRSRRFQFTAETTFKTQEHLWGAIRQTDFQLLMQAIDLPEVPPIYDLFLQPQATAV